jgi:plasmid stabilization system protein ParE
MENNPAYTVVYSSRAAKEINDSYLWYEERQPGLGERFLQQVLNKIDTIQQTPEIYASKYKNYPEVSIGIFPVVVVYRIYKRKHTIYVLSVFHTARNFTRKY